MTSEQWKYFCDFKETFKKQCEIWAEPIDQSILDLQNQARILDKVPDYKIENPIVYNTDLENMTINSDIKLIIIGDNPGKEEQMNINKKYLCGLSGKIADGYFNKNPQLNIKFRQNVIILNKTPIHTAKTKELKYVSERSEYINEIMTNSQIFMAEQIVKLQKALNVPVWIVGYSEIKEKGLFQVFREKLLELYNTDDFRQYYDKLFIFQHFSMNRFSIDLAEFAQANPSIQALNLQQQIETLGKKHRDEILGTV